MSNVGLLMKNIKRKSTHFLPPIAEDKTLNSGQKEDLNDVSKKRSLSFTDMLDEVNKIDRVSHSKRRRSNAITSEEEALNNGPLQKPTFAEKVSQQKVLQK